MQCSQSLLRLELQSHMPETRYKVGIRAFKSSTDENRWAVIHSQAILATLQCMHPFQYSQTIAGYCIRICFASIVILEISQNKLCHDPMKAKRIGEADNPGPTSKKKKSKPVQAVVAIINTTAIRNKHDEFQKLIDLHQVNTFFCSETTATAEVQTTMTHQFNKMQLSTVWSSPVQTQREKVSNQPSLRGRAGGTSIHATWPIREGMSVHEHSKAPDRLTHAVVQWGGIYVQIITIYGYAGGNAWHKQATNQLFEVALKKAEAINLPVMFTGDFNMDVHQLDLYDYLASKGYASLQCLHERMYDVPMPKTCKNATTPDTAILHPTLIQRLVAIQIDTQKLFDAHEPVILTFDVPQTPLYNTKISTPKSWVDMPIDKKDIEQAAQVTCQFADPQDLQQWAALVEATVDLAIKKEFANQPDKPYAIAGLPKRCRGRCTENKFRQIPMVTPARKARHGDYNPPMECATFRSKKYVKQIRRLASLRSRINSLIKAEDILQKTYIELWREWTAIWQWSDRGRSFRAWSLDHPELFPFPESLPTQDWLSMAQQLMQHQLNDILYHEHSLREKMSKVRHLIDCKDNFKKEAYKTIKKQVFQPFHHIYCKHEEEAIVIPIDNPNQYECFVEASTKYQLAMPIQIQGVEAALLQRMPDSIIIQMPENHEPLPEQATVKQAQCTFQVSEVFEGLSNFWQQFWYKEIPDDGFGFEETFQQPPLRYPAMDDNFEDDIQIWKEAIASTKGDSAPGVDGFTFQELKMLPDQLLVPLVKIISKMDEFPNT